MIKLSKCGCGGKAKYIVDEMTGDRGWVQCPKCRVHTVFGGLDDIAEVWNTAMGRKR